MYSNSVEKQKINESDEEIKHQQPPSKRPCNVTENPNKNIELTSGHLVYWLNVLNNEDIVVNGQMKTFKTLSIVSRDLSTKVRPYIQNKSWFVQHPALEDTERIYQVKRMKEGSSGINAEYGKAKYYHHQPPSSTQRIEVNKREPT
eukprot:TRINITY_DN8460_c0_g2_i3.p1 TRINITY_DN8460_c0_g2~~TRINITY_DN8460_c0_g2_i3.p1  ORF type:complete len:146 (+),score=41.33 TRINITY_DN8460_c0_g2_i3:223-660(+)